MGEMGPSHPGGVGSGAEGSDPNAARQAELARAAHESKRPGRSRCGSPNARNYPNTRALAFSFYNCLAGFS